MNINNLYEAEEYDKFGKIIYAKAKRMRPVTRESIEAFLREFGEKVWDSAANREWGEIYNENNPEDKIEITAPDKQTAITELITQTLGQ